MVRCPHVGAMLSCLVTQFTPHCGTHPWEADAMLEQMFALRTRGATVGTEVLAGATTFMVMAYIIFVNPAILSFAGMPGLTGQGPGFAPTLATIVAMPLTYSITNGIGTGMLFYAFIKIMRGKAHELSPTLCIVALAFLMYFI